MKQIGTSKIADNSITSTKPAESFVKIVEVNDTPAGHAVGWDPNGVDTFFIITDPNIIGAPSGPVTSYVSAVTTGPTPTCKTSSIVNGAFTLECETAPPDL